MVLGKFTIFPFVVIFVIRDQFLNFLFHYATVMGSWELNTNDYSSLTLEVSTSYMFIFYVFKPDLFKFLNFKISFTGFQ